MLLPICQQLLYPLGPRAHLNELIALPRHEELLTVGCLQVVHLDEVAGVLGEPLERDYEHVREQIGVEELQALRVQQVPLGGLARGVVVLEKHLATLLRASLFEGDQGETRTEALVDLDSELESMAQFLVARVGVRELDLA